MAKINHLGKALESSHSLIRDVSTYQNALEEIKYNFPPANHISQHFEDGDFVIHDFFFDSLELQRKWARENGFKWRAERYFQSQILFRQIHEGEYNVILFQGGLPQFQEFEFERFRAKNPHLRLVLAHIGHKHDSFHMRGVNIVLGINEEFADHYEKEGFESYVYPHSFNEKLLLSVQQKDFCDRSFLQFLGSSGYSLPSHAKRYEFIRTVIAKNEGNFFLEEYDNFLPPSSIVFSDKDLFYELKQRTKSFRSMFRRNVGTKDAKEEDREMRLAEEYPEKVFPSKYGLEMFKTLANSRVTFHVHQNSTANAGAMRLFEATGLGVCLMSDGSGFRDFFKDDLEFVHFDSFETFSRKLSMLKSDSNALQHIAASGRERTLRSHTSKIRSQEFARLVLKNY